MRWCVGTGSDEALRYTFFIISLSEMSNTSPQSNTQSVQYLGWLAPNPLVHKEYARSNTRTVWKKCTQANHLHSILSALRIKMDRKVCRSTCAVTPSGLVCIWTFMVRYVARYWQIWIPMATTDVNLEEVSLEVHCLYLIRDPLFPRGIPAHLSRVSEDQIQPGSVSGMKRPKRDIKSSPRFPRPTLGSFIIMYPEEIDLCRNNRAYSWFHEGQSRSHCSTISLFWITNQWWDNILPVDRVKSAGWWPSIYDYRTWLTWGYAM